jgi:hypothetical protein
MRFIAVLLFALLVGCGGGGSEDVGPEQTKQLDPPNCVENPALCS